MVSRLFCLLLFTASLYAQTTQTVSFKCGARSEPFLKKANRLLLAELALQPVEANQIGLHQYQGKSLDEQFDDYSPAGVAAQRAVLKTGRACLNDAAYRNLAPEDNADLLVLRDSIDSFLFQLDRMQAYKYQPQIYPEMIGAGLFFPLTQTNGTEQQRLQSVVARMEKLPAALDQAKRNLVEADQVFIDTAAQENEGNKGVIKLIGGKIGKESPLRPRFDAASAKAMAAIDAFSKWLKDDLAKRPHHRTWRTGPELYNEIFRYSLGPGTKETPQSVLAEAEAALQSIRSEMLKVAAPAHAKWFPDHGDHSNLSAAERLNKIVSEVIGRINDDHSAPEHLLEQVTAEAHQARQFIVEKNLLTLSSRDNMKIVPTPAFLRGIYSVAGFHSAPALEPQSEAQFWVTPIEPGTPAAKAESKLREYNNWMLQYLVMHEALPGHYTQFEHANDVTPPARRVLRQVLSSNPYAEGWGEYAVKEMEDAGYADHDPRFVLMVLKIRLRVVINAILDIRLQSMNMPEQEALDLMEHQGFQTKAEAEGKLLRAKLSSGQLITYFVGYHQWTDFRERYQRAAGPRFNLKRFNDDALNEGPLPVPLVEQLMMQKLGK